MKKIIIIKVLLTSLVTSNVWADPTSVLKYRLEKINSFHAIFTQKIIDSRGKIIQEGYGDLWVKRPNMFRWHLNQPDENFLISDGKTLWFYNPSVKQATATWLKDATSNTPFKLIVHNQVNDWQQYNIKQTDNNFELKPRSVSSNLKLLAINVNKNGTINQFTTIGQDNQCSSYRFRYYQNSAVDISKFNFIPPQGVMVDDQRDKQ